jgi:hypothetical protein
MKNSKTTVMKKSMLFLFTMMALLSTASCSKDESVEQNYNEAIVGRWLLQSISRGEVVTNNATATKAIQDYIDTELVVDPDDDISLLEFRKDNSMYFLFANNPTTYEEAWKYTISGNVLDLKFEKNGNIDKEKYTITELSNDKLSLAYDDVINMQYQIKYLAPSETNVVVSKAITIYNYKKQ